MLAPEDRRLYSECFAAPDGHVFDCALGTTYSLDLDSLLFALFCLATSGAEDPEVALGNPVSLLEAIHRVSHQVTVFCHAGETNAPRRPQSLYGLIEPCLVPATGRGEGLFHPKLWLLRFRPREGGKALLRAVVLSRNLTASRAWDAFVCLEGSPDGQPREESRELAEFIRAVPELCVHGHSLTEARAGLLSSLAQDVERTSFAAPLPFEGIASFMALGIAPGRGFVPGPSGGRVLAISPFVSPATLSVLRQLAPQAQLVSRPEEMGKCPPEIIAEWEAFALHPAASSDADSSTEPEALETADAAPQGLHAKALVIESGHQTTWWLGSGNLTDPVRLGNSVELLVRLQGKTSRVGVEQLWDSGFRALRASYQHQPPADDPAEGSRAKVERAKRLLSQAKLSLRCERREELWDLVLEGAVLPLEDVAVCCRPVSLAASRELRWNAGISRYCFEHVSVEALTAFLVVQLRAGQGETQFELSFTLKLPIANLPAERDARIARGILKDEAAFMSYLRSLLADLGDGLLEAAAAHRASDGTEQQLLTPTVTSGLLEILLRALHREPERLRGLRSLIEQTSSNATEASPIPPAFREVWSAVEPHLSAQARTHG